MFGSSVFSYSAYGLRIESAVRLPGFVEVKPPGDSKADVEIIHRKITERDLLKYFAGSAAFETPDCSVRVSKSAMCFEYPQTGTILVSDGNRVAVDLRAGAPEEDLVPYLTGYVLAVVLHQRNSLVLHASVVTVNGAGVAFVGAKGQGKSTMAASLQSSGARLISDDLLPIVFENGRAFAIPGYPQIKLFRDSVTAVGEIPERLPAAHPKNSKYAYFCEQFSHDPAPLSAVYVLNIDDEISIDRMGMPEAFIEATKHTHVSYYLRESGSFEWHFEKCRELVRSVPFFWLNRPHDYRRIDEVTEALRHHANELTDDELMDERVVSA